MATYLDTDNSYESTQLRLGINVRKPLLGLEGVATSIGAARIGQNSWDLDTILPLGYAIPDRDLDRVATAVQTNFANLLSRDVYSEGDARSLDDHIMTRSTHCRFADLNRATRIKSLKGNE